MEISMTYTIKPLVWNTKGKIHKADCEFIASYVFDGYSYYEIIPATQGFDLYMGAKHGIVSSIEEGKRMCEQHYVAKLEKMLEKIPSN